MKPNPLNTLHPSAIGLLLLLFPSCEAEEETGVHLFVKDGKKTSVIESGWTQGDGYIEGDKHQQSSTLYATKELGGGDFRVSVQVSMPDDSSAGFIELGPTQLHFERGELWIEGRAVTNKTVFASARPHLKSDSLVTIRITGAEGELMLEVNEGYMGTLKQVVPVKGKIGIYPTRGLIRVRSFFAAGDLVDPR